MDKIKVYLDEGAFTPERAYPTDAGMDLRTPCDFVLYHDGMASIDTGVHIEIPQGYVGILKSKSGLNVHKGITTTGVIDSGYTGSIVVCMHNDSLQNWNFNRGDKLTQLVILPIETPSVELVESLDEFGKSDRGSDGFGSTGI